MTVSATTACRATNVGSQSEEKADSEARARLAGLYVQLRPAVLARCRVILGDAAAAEDATQETFLRVHRHADSTPADAEVRAWILRIATNTCLSELRSNRRRLRRHSLDHSGYEQRSLPTSHAELAVVGRLLRGAPGPVQQVVHFCCLEGLEQAAAARMLGVSTRTVAARLARFRQQVRRALEQEPAEQELGNARSGDSSR